LALSSALEGVPLNTLLTAFRLGWRFIICLLLYIKFIVCSFYCSVFTQYWSFRFFQIGLSLLLKWSCLNIDNIVSNLICRLWPSDWSELLLVVVDIPSQDHTHSFLSIFIWGGRSRFICLFSLRSILTLWSCCTIDYSFLLHYSHVVPINVLLVLSVGYVQIERFFIIFNFVLFFFLYFYVVLNWQLFLEVLSSLWRIIELIYVSWSILLLFSKCLGQCKTPILLYFFIRLIQEVLSDFLATVRLTKLI